MDSSIFSDSDGKCTFSSKRDYCVSMSMEFENWINRSAMFCSPILFNAKFVLSPPKSLSKTATITAQRFDFISGIEPLMIVLLERITDVKTVFQKIPFPCIRFCLDGISNRFR